jgi:chaperonin GroEL (HSP60 family)
MSKQDIVPGGDVAYIRAPKALENVKFPGEQRLGVNIAKRVLGEPLGEIKDGLKRLSRKGVIA